MEEKQGLRITTRDAAETEIINGDPPEPPKETTAKKATAAKQAEGGK